MGWWSSDTVRMAPIVFQVLTMTADTSVPIPKNANTSLQGHWTDWLVYFGWSGGHLPNLNITPDAQERMKSWRPPRFDDIDLEAKDSNDPYVIGETK
jgi:hypothetical protein